MAWRNAGLDRKPEADALGRALWNGATRSGDNLWGGQPSDLTALGLAALRNGVELDDDGRVEGRTPGSEAPNKNGAADDQAELETPGYKTVTARPGDSISRLMRTSRPAAIGRFATLNGLNSSALQAGQSYRVPTSFDATPDDAVVGGRLLRSDNARLAAIHTRAPADPAPNDLFAQRFNAGQNVWTGLAAGRSPTPALQATPPDPPNPLDEFAKGVGGKLGYVGGVIWGVPRAGYHAARDIKDLGEFGFKAVGAFGPEARQEALRQGADNIHAALQYGRAAMDDPSKVSSDVGDLSRAAIKSIDPRGAPMSGSLGDVVGYEFGKGANLSEGVANVAAAFAAPELGIGALRAATFDAKAASRIAKLVNEGANPRLAEYLAEPYEGMGHHAIVPRRFKIPETIRGIPVDDRLAGKPLPSWIVDSPLNVSKPLGMSRDDFYKYHYGVDERFHGARLPADLNGGKGWSGKRQGLQRHSRPMQVWAGMPVPLKGGIAAAGVGDGFGAPSVFDQGSPQ